MVLAVLCLAFLCRPQEEKVSTPSPALMRFVELFAGEEPTADPTAFTALAGLPGVHELVLSALEDWRAPSLEPGEDGRRLDEARRAELVVLAQRLPAEAWRKPRSEFVRSEDVARLRAGLRLEGALGRAATVRALFALATRAQELGRATEVEEALVDGLALLLAREPRTADALRGAWGELPVELAPSVLAALARQPSPGAVDCVRAWLGRRSELDAAVLLTLSGLHASVDEHRREDLAGEVQACLGSDDPQVAQAAATALGRLGTPDSVPWLFELLVHDEPAVQRAALGALRGLGGVRLPGSTAAWRAWYAREETWYQEHAPALLDELVAAEASAEPVAATRALLRELSEHRLHREELAEHIRPLLEHELPRLRVLACQAFERLAARRALPWLVEALSDPEPNVVSAAHAALCALEGVRLGTEPALWRARLGLAEAPAWP